MNPRAYIFDMDGVLCDSESLLAEAAIQVMSEQYGVGITSTFAAASLMEVGADECWPAFVKSASPLDEIDALHHRVAAARRGAAYTGSACRPDLCVRRYGSDRHAFVNQRVKE